MRVQRRQSSTREHTRRDWVRASLDDWVDAPARRQPLPGEEGEFLPGPQDDRLPGEEGALLRQELIRRASARLSRSIASLRAG